MNEDTEKDHDLSSNSHYTSELSENKTVFTQCRHILKMVKNLTDIPPVHTKMVNILAVDIEKGRY